DLEVAGFRSAVVALPRDDSGPRPLAMATHGAGGSPEDACRMLTAALDESAFVLCPRGKPLNALLPADESGFYYPDHRALGREIAASLDALRARYGPRIDISRALYVGYSQGATMGSFVLSKTPFTRAALVEGGYSGWNVAAARAFRAAGGERVLFGCGGRHCSVPARASAESLRRAGVEARVVGSDTAGHTFGGAVGAAVLDSLPWLLGGDARFRIARNAP